MGLILFCFPRAVANCGTSDVSHHRLPCYGWRGQAFIQLEKKRKSINMLVNYSHKVGKIHKVLLIDQTGIKIPTFWSVVLFLFVQVEEERSVIWVCLSKIDLPTPPSPGCREQRLRRWSLLSFSFAPISYFRAWMTGNELELSVKLHFCVIWHWVMQENRYILFRLVDALSSIQELS